MDSEDSARDSTINLLITHVRERRSLWHPEKQSIPGIKKAQQRMWSDVAMLQNSSVDEVKSKWKNIRRSFQKQLQKIPKNESGKFITNPQNFSCDWKYYRQMLFSVNPKDVIQETPNTDDVNNDGKRLRVAEGELIDLSPKRIKVSSSSGNLEENILFDAVSQSNNDSNDPSVLDTSEGISNENEATPNINQVHLFDSDYLYLLSFHEFLRSVPAERKLKVRAAISRAISTIVENDYNGQQENDSNY